VIRFSPTGLVEERHQEQGKEKSHRVALKSIKKKAREDMKKLSLWALTISFCGC